MTVIFSNSSRILSLSLYTYIHVHKYVSCINYDPTQVKSRLGHCPYKALIHTVHMLKTIHIELFLSLSLLSLCIQAPFSGVFLCPSSTKHFLRLPTCLQRDKVFHLHNALHFFFDSDILFQAFHGTGDSQFIQ